MNIKKIAYWVATIAMCGLFLYSAQMYFLKTEMVNGFFEGMGFPTWIVIPLAVAKILGIIAILTDANSILREWAYAGFFFDVILATGAHHHAGHGIVGFSLYGIVLVLLSRALYSARKSEA